MLNAINACVCTAGRVAHVEVWGTAVVDGSTKRVATAMGDGMHGQGLSQESNSQWQHFGLMSWLL